MNQPDTEKVARDMSPEAAIKRLTAFANALYATSLDDGKKMIADIEVITHLREQLQLSQSQVGRCVEELNEVVKQSGSYVPFSLQGGRDHNRYHAGLSKRVEHFLSSLPTTPNYVKRVEELEKNILQLLRKFAPAHIPGAWDYDKQAVEIITSASKSIGIDDPWKEGVLQQTLNKQAE